MKTQIISISNAREGINSTYVMSTLKTYIKRQSLRSAYVDIAKALQKDAEESLGEAEALMAKAQSVNLSVFDPGIRLSNKKALAFLDVQSRRSLPAYLNWTGAALALHARSCGIS